MCVRERVVVWGVCVCVCVCEWCGGGGVCEWCGRPKASDEGSIEFEFLQVRQVLADVVQ